VPRARNHRRYDRLRVEVLDARIVTRRGAGRVLIRDVIVTLRKPAGEVTRAFVSYATLRSHGLIADGNLSIVGGHYDVAIRGLGDGRSIIREWGAECVVPSASALHELNIALTQVRACADALGIVVPEGATLVPVFGDIVARLAVHRATIDLHAMGKS
jgi:hypothetical protein